MGLTSAPSILHGRISLLVSFTPRPTAIPPVFISNPQPQNFFCIFSIKWSVSLRKFLGNLLSSCHSISSSSHSLVRSAEVLTNVTDYNAPITVMCSVGNQLFSCAFYSMTDLPSSYFIDTSSPPFTIFLPLLK